MTSYTHGHAEPVLRSHRWRTAANSAAHLLPHLGAGMRLLDVGSGAGTITADLAGLVAPGRVTALEATEDALAHTRAGLAERGVEADLVVGDAHDLPFPDDAFDVVHAHQVLQHLADPVLALREMRRVCRPGGVLAVRDADYGAFTWWPQEPGLDTWLDVYRRTARANGGEPDAGRRLLHWALAAGLVDPEVTASTWTFATPQDRARWGRTWAERVTGSAFGEQLRREGHLDATGTDALAAAWRRWAAAPDGWFVVVHGDLLAHA